MNTNDSILSFARKMAKERSAKLKIIGIALAIISSAIYSIHHHYSVTNTALSIAKSNLAESLQVGGTYYQTKLVSSMIKADLFSDVWVYDANNRLVLKDGQIAGDTQGESFFDRKLYFADGVIPYALIKSDINYFSQKVGRIYVLYEFPLTKLLLILLTFIYLFSKVVNYLKNTALDLGQEIATPVHEFTKDIISQVENNHTGHKYKFKELEDIESWLKEYLKDKKEADEISKKAINDAVVARIASKSRHDIHNVLFIAGAALDELPPEYENTIHILKSSLQRINKTIDDIPKLANLNDNDIEKIAPNLSRIEPERIESCHLFSIVKDITPQISLLNKNIKLEFNFDEKVNDVYVEVDYEKFERVLINLYKNAIESINIDGIIITNITQADSKVEISIQDNGCGMPLEVLQKLGSKGNTYGKAKGTGLGVYQAYEQVEAWQGNISYNSDEDKGTQVVITLPISQKNYLYPNSLTLPENGTVIILDDDLLVHDFWKSKFKDMNITNIDFKYFENPSDAKLEVDNLKEKDSEFILLSDYDLRDESTNGLDFISDNHLEDNSFLMTSNIKLALDECRKRDIPVLSKSIQRTIEIYTV